MDTIRSKKGKNQYMKKTIIFIFIFILLMCTSCGDDNQSNEKTDIGSGSSAETGDGNSAETGDGDSAENGDGDSAENGDGDSAENGDGDSAENGDGDSAETGDGDSADVDLDLTTMSSTMIFAQISDVVFNVQNYLGTSLRLNGTFQLWQDSNTETKKNIYVVMVWDAMGCCPQGIELRLPEGMEKPKDLSDIQVEGIISLRNVDKYQYLYIDVTDLDVI